MIALVPRGRPRRVKSFGSEAIVRVRQPSPFSCHGRDHPLGDHAARGPTTSLLRASRQPNPLTGSGAAATSMQELPGACVRRIAFAVTVVHRRPEVFGTSARRIVCAFPLRCHDSPDQAGAGWLGECSAATANECLLGSVLGEAPRARTLTRDARRGPLAPEDRLDQCAVSTGTSTSGRTSTAPPSRTAGIRCANSSASSRLDASNTK
jgi:hypothetical protein